MKTKLTWKKPTLKTYGTVWALTHGGHGKEAGGSDAWISRCPGSGDLGETGS